MDLSKVVLIEDQADFHILIKRLLGNSVNLLWAKTASEGIDLLIAHSDIDLILLDVSLPDGDGFQLMTQIQNLGSAKAVPVIFLTGKNETTDKVTGFALGAEDYIVKPFDLLEFRARIEAKLQKISAKKRNSAIKDYGKFVLNSAQIRAFEVDPITGEHKDLNLTPHEFRLLSHFISHEKQVFSRNQLISVVWGESTHVLERTVDRHVSTLRKKLKSSCGAIEAVLGEGYRFIFIDSKSKKSAA